MKGEIEVIQIAGLATIQDGGRPGRMHEGIPPGGALVPEWLARANRAAGNGDCEAAIEVFGTLRLAARRGPVTIATEEGDVRTLGEGETIRIEGRRERRVRYVAVRGGLEVPEVLGGRGTLLVAGMGGGVRESSWKKKRARASGGPRANAAIPAPAKAKAMPMVTAPRPAAGNRDRPRPASTAAMPGAIRSRP